MVDQDRLLHDAQIEAIEVGPRREVRLRVVQPVSCGSTAEGSKAFILRFGAIENFPEVRGFFDGLPRPAMPGAYWDEILELRQVGKGWLLELDHGGRVEIHSGKPPDIEPAHRSLGSDDEEGA